jgi:hypothetical protein
MHQPPYSFAEPPSKKAPRWPMPRILIWIVLFLALAVWAYLILEG